MKYVNIISSKKWKEEADREFEKIREINERYEEIIVEMIARNEKYGAKVPEWIKARHR